LVIFIQAVQDELRDMDQQLQSVSQVVSSLRLYLTDSAADEVDHELAALTEQLRDLHNETAQIADEIARAQESSSKLHTQLTEFDDQLDSADRSVMELNYMYADELTAEDASLEVSCCCWCSSSCMEVTLVEFFSGWFSCEPCSLLGFFDVLYFILK